MKITVITNKGKKTNKVFDLNETVFASTLDGKLLRQAVHVHLANSRTGTAKAKGRSEVSGTGKKPWANNKMGRARTGDLRTPIYRGGGVSHGPVPMNYGLKLTEKMRKGALALALTDTVAQNKLFVVEDFSLKDERMTRQAAALLRDIADATGIETKRTLIYTQKNDEVLLKAFRNIPNVRVYKASHMNPFDLLSASAVLVFESAMTGVNKSEAKTIVAKVSEEKKPEIVEKKAVKEEAKVKAVKKPASPIAKKSPVTQTTSKTAKKS